jgi:hypothetical protein
LGLIENCWPLDFFYLAPCSSAKFCARSIGSNFLPQKENSLFRRILHLDKQIFKNLCFIDLICSSQCWILIFIESICKQTKFIKVFLQKDKSYLSCIFLFHTKKQNRFKVNFVIWVSKVNWMEILIYYNRYLVYWFGEDICRWFKVLFLLD